MGWGGIGWGGVELGWGLGGVGNWVGRELASWHSHNAIKY